MPTRIILVRHGQSTFNAAKRFQGRCDDSVLTTNGHLAAYQTGLALNHIAFDAVYTSPLRRAQETVQEMVSAIAAVFNTPPPLHTHTHLQEIHLPEWQGLPYQDVRSRFAEAYRQWQEAPHLLQMQLDQPKRWSEQNHATMQTLIPAVNTFFPLHQLYAQAMAFWQEILPQHSDQTLLIVSHGGTIRALISTAIGLDISQFHFLQQSNSGISELIFNDSQQLTTLQAMNLTGHLGEILPKLKNGKQGIRIILLPIDHQLADIAPLVARLNAIPIEFCLTDTRDRIKMTATKILNQLPNPGVQLQFHQPNFLLNWKSRIHAGTQAHNKLSTGLVVTSVSAVHSFLHHTLNLPESSRALIVKPETLTVLYYPATTQHPVLQVMNLDADAIDRS